MGWPQATYTHKKIKSYIFLIIFLLIKFKIFNLFWTEFKDFKIFQRFVNFFEKILNFIKKKVKNIIIIDLIKVIHISCFLIKHFNVYKCIHFNSNIVCLICRREIGIKVSRITFLISDVSREYVYMEKHDDIWLRYSRGVYDMLMWVPRAMISMSSRRVNIVPNRGALKDSGNPTDQPPVQCEVPWE